MKVCWISAGVSSFIAGVLGKADKYVYIDIADQHPDSMRFIKDCEKALGKEIEIIRNEDFENTTQVFYKRRFIVSPYGAPCTQELKKAVRRKWETDFLRKYGTKEFLNLVYIWGYDADETKRKEKILANFPEIKHEFPLIDRSMTKQSVHGYFATHYDFPRPKMYDLGYANNNCVGCVKGGMGYWNKIRIDFPEVFKQRAEMERDIGASILKDCYLDELEPNRGRMTEEIMPDCDILCYLASSESDYED